MNYLLSEHELQQFEELGVVGPFPLLNPDEVDSITKQLTSAKFKFFLANYIFSKIPPLKDKFSAARWGKGKWHKGIHASAPLVYKLATESAIVDRISSILGQDILLWSSIVLNIRPSDRPAWHTDTELRDWNQWEGATAWLALSNVEEQSGMKVITRSHRLPLTIEDIRKKSELNTFDDDAILQAARQFDPKCECIPIKTKPGEFFIFATRAWHTGSKFAKQKIRNSIIFQYVKPSVAVKMPVNDNPPIVWSTRSLPCILVRGSDEYGKNMLVAPPK